MSSVCFDEASTMSGHISGVQTKCKEQNNELAYVHCYAHCFNLVLVDACLSSGKQNVVRFLRYFATCTQLHWKQGCAPCCIRANLPNCWNKVKNFEVVVYHLVSMCCRSCKGCSWEIHWTVKCCNKDSEDYITPRGENKGPGSPFPVHEVWLCVLHRNSSPFSTTSFKG